MSWSDAAKPDDQLLKLTLVVELLTATEIIRIALGLLRGDLALGFVVHYTRIFMWFVAFPNPAVTSLTAKLILVAWSATEVARYPMVLFPNVPALKVFRYTMPLVTFPLGAGMEAWAAYKVPSVTTHQVLYGI